MSYYKKIIIVSESSQPFEQQPYLLTPMQYSDQGSSIPASSYSTIFHCTESGFVCSLRAVEGLFALFMFVKFLSGYNKMEKQRNNPISNQQKKIYLLAMGQTLLLSFYYLLFEEFVILATIRNFLIWIAINILHVMCKIYWLEDQNMLKYIKYGINALKIINIIMWFGISLGQGTTVVNTDFNLGYNCRVIDWTILSGILLIVISTEGFIGSQIYEKLKWEKSNTLPEDKQKLESIQYEQFQIIYLLSASFAGAFVMFMWDFYAYNFSTSDHQCTEIFSGNNFFRQVLCFLLKLVSMQLTPCMIYYVIYQKRKTQFLENFQTDRIDDLNVDILKDDASEFNRTIGSRIDSRGSLFSEHNQNRGSQYN